MSKRIWPKSEEHPPLAALTLHLEGELEGREAVVVAQHLNACWICRRELERLERGVYAFVDYRREVLLPSTAPPLEPGGLLRRLRQEAVRKPRRSLPQFALSSARALASRVPRSAWVISGASAALLSLLIAVWISAPPRLTAAEFLRKARTARSSTEAYPHTVIYQKVRIRRGSAVFQRAAYRGAKILSVAPLAANDTPDRETIQALKLAGINWQDPLNADDFAAWHDVQRAGSDQVTLSAGRVTLKTEGLRDSPVAAASLTVSQADWHPVARNVEFRDEPPLEVTELAYEFREAPSLETPSTALSLATPVVKPDIEVMRGPSERDLEENELRLREALHKIEADVREAPEVRKMEQGIELRAWADSEERKQEILHAAAGIPDVKPINQGSTSGGSSGSSDVTVQAAPVYSTAPPLAKALWDYLGGLDVANNYLAELGASFDRILADASALGRLSERYSGKSWEQLTPGMRARVDRLAADYLAVIRSESEVYTTRMSSVLDEMLRRNNLAAEEEGSTTGGGCQPWQTFAPIVLEDIKQLHTSFRRLFVEEQLETPVTLFTQDLLRASARGRTRLSAHLRGVCQPWPFSSGDQQ